MKVATMIRTLSSALSVSNDAPLSLSCYAGAVLGMQIKPRKRLAVIICARMWSEADRKMRDWIKNHPREKVLLKIPIVFTEYERYCGALLIETDSETLPSDTED
jgi:hypothetical protein